MPDASIVIKATDRFSDSMKTMRDSSKAFSKDIDGLQSRLNSLNKTKAVLKVDTDKARSDLRAAEKQFAATGNAIDKLILESKQLTFEQARRNLSLVNKEASSVERQMLKMGNALSKVENRAGGGINAVVEAFAASGMANMLGGLLGGIGTSGIGSAFGSSAGTIASSALSSVATGAALGSMLLGPGVGTVVGSAAGALVGAASGGLQVMEQRDDAFKSYVQEAVENQLSGQTATLTSGSTIAGSREQNFMAFAQKFGSAEAAAAYLNQVKGMAKSTNYTYDEITGYSKLLLNTYDKTKTLQVLKTLSDASAGLNLGSSDVNMFISGFSRMRTTGKTTQEYLNYFSERGVDVYQALANATGADKSSIAEMVTKGQIGGADAAEAILTYIDQTYGGLSEKLSTTYDAMVDNLSDYQADMDAAMGEGYNEGRKSGLQAQMDWMSGESGKAVEEANKAIGAWQAELENQKEQFVRDAMDAMMASEEYQTAKAEGNAAEMGRLIMQAKVQGMNEYNASEGAQLALESELSLAASIRDDTSTDNAYWDAGYRKGQAYTTGLMAGMLNRDMTVDTTNPDNIMTPGSASGRPSLRAFGFAAGIDYVPYDNFPALLHEGERVQTAVEARSGRYDGGRPVVISGNSFTIREEADVSKVASELLRQMELAEMRG